MRGSVRQRSSERDRRSLTDRRGRDSSDRGKKRRERRKIGKLLLKMRGELLERGRKLRKGGGKLKAAARFSDHELEYISMFVMNKYVEQLIF